MERFVYQQLVDWKEAKGRKPLVFNGARQVGKTRLLKEFAQREYAERYSMLPYKEQESMTNVPLYAV